MLIPTLLFGLFSLSILLFSLVGVKSKSKLVVTAVSALKLSNSTNPAPSSFIFVLILASKLLKSTKSLLLLLSNSAKSVLLELASLTSAMT